MTSNGNLEVPKTPACAFCDYLSGARPYTVLDRDGISAILVTREQRGVSHLLVVPIRHVETILSLHDDESASVMQNVVRAARAIDAADGRPGIAVWQNNGIAADQTIPHVHFHVAGTFPGGGTERGHVEELSVEETDRIAERLRTVLKPTNSPNS